MFWLSIGSCLVVCFWVVLVVFPGFWWLGWPDVVGYVMFCVCGLAIWVVLVLRWSADFVFGLFSEVVGYGL